MSGKSSSIDPSALTVADLKKELAKNQVQFDNKKVKQYYVDLFREKIQNVPGTVFSSDDEEEDAGKRKTGGRSQARGRRSLATGREAHEAATSLSNDLEVDTLSDEELRQELLLRGEHPGPVTTLTRALYERQLRNILNQNDDSSKVSARASAHSRSLPATPTQRDRQRNIRQDMEFSGDESEGSKGQEKVQAAVKASPSRRRSELDKLRMDAPGPKSVLAEELLARPSNTPLTRRTSQRLRDREEQRETDTSQNEAAVGKETTATPSRRVSGWAGLGVVIALAVFAFLLFNGYLMQMPKKR